MARLALVQGVVTVLASGLGFLASRRPRRCGDRARCRSDGPRRSDPSHDRSSTTPEPESGMSMADDNHSRSVSANDPIRPRPAAAAGASEPRQRSAGRAGAADRPERSVRRSGAKLAQAHRRRTRRPVDRRRLAAAQRAALRAQPGAAPPPRADRRTATTDALSLALAAGYAEADADYAAARRRPAGLRPTSDHSQRVRRSASGYGVRLWRSAAPISDDADPRYHDDGHAEQPHDDEMYDDSARRAAAAAACSTALRRASRCACWDWRRAFGYRALLPRPPADRQPPGRSQADTRRRPRWCRRPSAMPQRASQSTTASATSGRPNRLVPREEQPVELRSRRSPPRVVLSAGPPAVPGSHPVPNRRSAVPTASERAGPSGPQPARPPRSAEERFAPAIRPSRAAPPRRAANATRALARPIAAARRAPARRRVAAASRAASAPLALDPSWRPCRYRRTGCRRQRGTAVAGPRRRQTAAPAGGGYAVQVTSQRSEADAQASFRSCRPNSRSCWAIASR